MSDNAQMTITEFLEARIAEDEAEAKWVEAEGDHGSSPVQHPARVLAECAAKRAIIKQNQSYVEAAAEREGIAFVGARCWQEVTGDVLKLFAAVYADHEDYRQEWAL